MAFRGLISKNLGWKLTAVLLALVSWNMLNTGVQESLQPGAVRTFVELPVNLLTPVSDRQIYRVQPAAVDVTVRGETDLIESLQPSEIEPYVSLTSIGDAMLQSKRVRLSLPTGITRVRVRPESVSVETAAETIPAAAPEE
jgi:hypothetical protein